MLVAGRMSGGGGGGIVEGGVGGRGGWSGEFKNQDSSREVGVSRA